MTSLFENQEAAEFLNRSYSLLMGEADRGCILLGVSLLDEELTSFFTSLLPKGTSNKRRKEIFDGRGAFGNISSKLNIAYTCQLLPEDLIESIHKLRKLRNNLAHRTSPFSIEENLEAIFEVFTLIRGNLSTGIAQLSGEIVHSNYIKKIMKIDHPTEEGTQFFKTEEEAIAYISGNDDVLKKLTEQRLKTMFALGIASLGALIIHNKEKVIKKLCG